MVSFSAGIWGATLFGVMIGLPVLGLVLFIAAWRGRRVGREARCRRCDYIIAGLPSRICPECGSSLDPKGAVVIGSLRRRRWILSISILMLLASLGYWGRAGYVFVSKDPYRFYPYRWLVAEAEADAPRALRELSRRYGNGRLSGGQIRDLAKAALRQQAVTPVPLSCPQWGALLEQLLQDGRLTETQTQRYLGQMVRFALEPTTYFEVGEPLSLQYTKYVCAPYSTYTAVFSEHALEVGGHTVFRRPKSPTPQTIFPVSGTKYVTRRPVRKPPALGAGEHEVVYSFVVEIYRVNYSERKQDERTIDPDTDERVHSRRVRLTGNWEIVPSNESDG